MNSDTLSTPDQYIRLVAPNIDRDVPLSMSWLSGEVGRRTLMLMGVPANEITEPTWDGERKRIADFIDGQQQWNWMISYNEAIVGSIWVDLEFKNNTPAPSVHIMIGDPATRGKGVGSNVSQAVIEYLHNKGYNKIYSRHLASNVVAAALLGGLGFVPEGGVYTDSNELVWQNVELSFDKE